MFTKIEHTLHHSLIFLLFLATKALSPLLGLPPLPPKTARPQASAGPISPTPPLFQSRTHLQKLHSAS